MPTNAVKLTKRTVDALLPREKAFIVFDADVKGFGVRVMPTGVKTFIFEYRPGAGGRGVAERRLTLGRYGGAMTVSQKRPRRRLRQLSGYPAAEKGRQRAGLSVADLIDAFLVGYVAKLKAKSQSAYAESLNKLRAAHGAVKAEALARCVPARGIG